MYGVALPVRILVRTPVEKNVWVSIKAWSEFPYAPQSMPW